jgi:uncharacterized LabA/DUF88 family protein
VTNAPDGQADQTARTILFIDYQNMYRSARDAFGWQSESGMYGNFRPYSLGRQVTGESDRVLTQVRCYTGIHTARGHPKLYAMMQRRMSAWVAQAPTCVQVFPRSLRYGRAGPQEKGVDVELAIDFVSLALDDAFDVGVLASGDTDLVPALQFVADRFPEKTLVTMGYAPIAGCEGATPQPLDLPRGEVDRRFVTKQQFERISDRRNYFESSADQSGDLDSDRWSRIQDRYRR